MATREAIKAARAVIAIVGGREATNKADLDYIAKVIDRETKLPKLLDIAWRYKELQR